MPLDRPVLREALKRASALQPPVIAASFREAQTHQPQQTAPTTPHLEGPFIADRAIEYARNAVANYADDLVKY